MGGKGNIQPLSEQDIVELMLSGKSYDDRFDTRTAEEKASGVHNTDRGKLPNYPTFSVESIYSTPEHQGGEWKYLDKNNKEIEEDSKGGIWHFYASPFNLKQHGAEGLKKHFETVDMDAVLHFPLVENNNRGSVWSGDTTTSFWK
jgi:hypothetical protein